MPHPEYAHYQDNTINVAADQKEIFLSMIHLYYNLAVLSMQHSVVSAGIPFTAYTRPSTSTNKVGQLSEKKKAHTAANWFDHPVITESESGE